jgi:integrase
MFSLGGSMPKLEKRLTDSIAKRLARPAVSYEIYWCGEAPGFGCRVPAVGNRAWVFERRVDGKNTRRTLGKAEGAQAISCATARGMMVEFSGELQQGIDRAVIKRDERRAEKEAIKADALTLAVALREYVKGKRRGKDGLPLKERTKADYLAMIEPGEVKASGRANLDGGLYELADKPLAKIDAHDMRSVYATLSKRGQRGAVYAMQVLRAVLNWHGIKVQDNPLGKEVAGRDRIVLPQTTGAPNPIPPERLGLWWRAACAGGSEEVGGTALAADACRFMLLTGCRPGEVFGSKHVTGIRACDLDIEGGSILLSDTKNRRNHVLLLSTQALDIATRNAAGKEPTELLFDIGDPRKTLDAINRAAGVTGISLHDLRATFASIAEELVSAYTLKRLINHTDTGDVTGAHYVGKSRTQLRLGWQLLADFIDGEAKVGDDAPRAKPAQVVPLRSAR